MLARTTLGLTLLGLAGFAGARFTAADAEQTRVQTKVQRHDRQIAELLRKVKALESANRALSNQILPKATMNVHDAAARGDITQLRYALNAGSAVDLKNGDQATPLMLACLAGKLRASRYLLVNGADIMAKDKDGKTPMSIAKEEGHQRLMSLLVDYGGR